MGGVLRYTVPVQERCQMSGMNEPPRPQVGAERGRVSRPVGRVDGQACSAVARMPDGHWIVDRLGVIHWPGSPTAP